MKIKKFVGVWVLAAVVGSLALPPVAAREVGCAVEVVAAAEDTSSDHGRYHEMRGCYHLTHGRYHRDTPKTERV